MNRIRSNPGPVLEEVGLSVPAGTKINIQDSQGEGNLDEQVSLRQHGHQHTLQEMILPDDDLLHLVEDALHE